MTNKSEAAIIPVKEEEMSRRFPKDKEANCPECGKRFTRRGLVGHLMFKHGREGREVGMEVKDAKLNPGDRAQKVFDLVEKLNTIRSQQAKVKKMEKGDFFSADESCEALREGLDELEHEVVEALEELGLRPKKRGFFS